MPTIEDVITTESPGGKELPPNEAAPDGKNQAPIKSKRLTIKSKRLTVKSKRLTQAPDGKKQAPDASLTEIAARFRAGHS